MATNAKKKKKKHTDKVCSPTAEARNPLPSHAPARGGGELSGEEPEPLRRGAGDATRYCEHLPFQSRPGYSLKKKKKGEREEKKKSSGERSGSKQRRGAASPGAAVEAGTRSRRGPCPAPVSLKIECGGAGGPAPGERGSFTARVTGKA